MNMGTAVAAASSRRNSRGLTLIEILLILAILGILMALAFPGLSAYIQQLRFQEGVRTFSESLLRARDTATNTSAAVRFEANGGTITWVDVVAGNTLGSASLPNGVTVASNVQVVLSGRGLPPGQVQFPLTNGTLETTVWLLPTGAILR